MGFYNFNNDYLNLAGATAQRDNDYMQSLTLNGTLSDSSGVIFDGETTIKVGSKLGSFRLGSTQYSVYVKAHDTASDTIRIAILSSVNINTASFDFLYDNIDGVLNIPSTSWRTGTSNGTFLNALPKTNTDNTSSAFFEAANNQTYIIKSGDNTYFRKASWSQGANSPSFSQSNASVGRAVIETGAISLGDFKLNLGDLALFFGSDSEPVVNAAEPVADAASAAPTADSDGKDSKSSFDIVNNKFGDYLDLVDRVALKLVQVKGDLDTAKALCKNSEGNQAACDTVTELETYVQGLEGQITTLTSEKTTLESFRTGITDELDNVSSTSTNTEIINALKAKLAATAESISDKDVEIGGLEAELETSKDNVEALETAIQSTLTAAEVSLTAEETLINGLNKIDEALEDAQDIARLTQNDLNAIKQSLIDGDKATGLDTFFSEEMAAAAAAAAQEGGTLTNKGVIDVFIAALQERVTTEKNNLKTEVDALIAAQKITQEEAATIDSLASDWATAVSDLASKELELSQANTELDEAGDASAALQIEIDDLTATNEAQANTISENEAELLKIESELEEANSELSQFGTLSTSLDNAITKLETTLSDNGITLDETSSFNGGGLSNVFGSEPTEHQKLLFRGIKARKAYLNMSGDGENYNGDNDLDSLGFNADGSDAKTNGLLKLGVIAGLLYVGSKLLKK